MSRNEEDGGAEWGSSGQRCRRRVNRDVEHGWAEMWRTEMWRMSGQRCEGRVGRDVEVEWADMSRSGGQRCRDRVG